MGSLLVLASWGGIILAGSFLALVVWKLLTGGIRLHGLLQGDRRVGGELVSGFSPGRAQLLLITLLSAVYYLLQVLHNPQAFPRVPDAMVGVLAGSQATYLGGKARFLLFKNGASRSERRTP